MSEKSDQSRYNSEWRERLLRDNLRNIEALVESGTPLTPGQVDIVKKSVEAEEKAAIKREEEGAEEVWVKSVSDLLQALGHFRRDPSIFGASLTPWPWSIREHHFLKA